MFKLSIDSEHVPLASNTDRYRPFTVSPGQFWVFAEASVTVKVCILTRNTSYTGLCENLMSQHVNTEHYLSYITLWISLEKGSSV